MEITLDALLARPGVHLRPDLDRRYGRRACDAAERSGAMVSLARGLWCGALHAESVWTAGQALVLAISARSAITGRCALFLSGCVLDAPPTALVVTTSPTRVRRSVPRARLLRTVHDFPLLAMRDLTVTAPEHALVHAMGEVGRVRGRAIALEALASGVVDVGEVAAMTHARRFHGRGALREALAAFDGGVRSILEYDGLTQVLTGEEFQDLLRQHTITVGGRRMVIDAYDPQTRIAFEFDGASFHTDRRRWERDRERDTLLASVGIQTVRFTFRDVRDRPQWCRARAREVRSFRVDRIAA